MGTFNLNPRILPSIGSYRNLIAEIKLWIKFHGFLDFQARLAGLSAYRKLQKNLTKLLTSHTSTLAFLHIVRDRILPIPAPKRTTDLRLSQAFQPPSMLSARVCPMKCQNCQFDNPDGMKFCGQCGRELQSLCPNCNHANPLDFTFCGNCGERLAGFAS